MNREKFCATPQYKKWRNELNQLKYILKNLDKENTEARSSVIEKINELKGLMKL